jgi:DNA-binding NtrC family response regulator
VVGDSEAFRRVRDLLETAGQNDLNLLLRGEVGTGKTLLARTLHARSERRRNWLIIVNCELIEAEDLRPLLVGSPDESGFEGVFRVASGGTVVLDHVESLDAEARALLNHLLEAPPFGRSGEASSPVFEGRLVSIASETFSRDTFHPELYYKLAQFPIPVPPLRDRDGDAVRLARHFLGRHTGGQQAHCELSLSNEAQTALEAHSWPGNVRELRNVMGCAVASASSPEIRAGDLMLPLRSPAEAGTSGGSSGETDPSPLREKDGDVLSAFSAGDDRIPTVEEIKEEAVRRAYDHFDQDVERAAVELGIGRSTMYRMLKRYEIK